MSDCFVLYLLLTCMKKKTSGADKFTNNNKGRLGDTTGLFRQTERRISLRSGSLRRRRKREV